MICDNLSSWKSLKATLPAPFAAGFAWIEKNKDKPPADGSYPLEKGMRVIVQTYDPKDLKGAQFENHRKFIDIQYIVQGAEFIFWTKPRKIPQVQAYSDEKDIEFFEMKDPVANSAGLLVEQGMFAIFWPSDWHMPCMNPTAVNAAYAGPKGKVKKFVVKVPI